MNSSERKITKRELKNLQSNLNRLWTDYYNIDILKEINGVSLNKDRIKSVINKYQKQSLQYVDKFKDNKKFNSLDINKTSNNILLFSNSIIIGRLFSDKELNDKIDNYLFKDKKTSILKVELRKRLNNMEYSVEEKKKEINLFKSDIIKTMDDLVNKRSFTQEQTIEIQEGVQKLFFSKFDTEIDEELISKSVAEFRHFLNGKWEPISKFEKNSLIYTDIIRNYFKPMLRYLNTYQSGEIDKLKILLEKKYPGLEFAYVEYELEEED